MGRHHFGIKVGASDDELREVYNTLTANGVPVHGATDRGTIQNLDTAEPTARHRDDRFRRTRHLDQARLQPLSSRAASRDTALN